VKREEDACSEVEWLREFGLLNRNAKGGDALYFEILSCFSLAVLSSFLVLVFTTNQEHWIWFKDSCTCPQSLDKCVSPSRSASSFISFPIKQSTPVGSGRILIIVSYIELLQATERNL
jgi:hypothetical protein